MHQAIRQFQETAQRREDLERLTALVQHSLNNPLAALLAEAQLLAMETTLDPRAPGGGRSHDGARAQTDRAGPRVGQQGQREDVPEMTCRVDGGVT